MTADPHKEYDIRILTKSGKDISDEVWPRFTLHYKKNARLAAAISLHKAGEKTGTVIMVDENGRQALRQKVEVEEFF